MAVNGRAYYYPVDTPALPTPATDRLEVLLSADPAAPDLPITGPLRLRPGPFQQPYYVFVRNTTAKAKVVLVQLKIGSASVPGGEAKVEVKPNTVQRIEFGPPPAKAAMQEMHAPLQLLLRDATEPDKLLDQKQIAVGIASPREYVRVTDVRFFPPGAANGGKNRLVIKLRAASPLVGRPCAVRLVLPPERIAGFMAANDGNFSGVLPRDGQELTLYANNIQLRQDTPDEAYFYLAVDGQQRAFIFRATFARQGDPTFPREDDRPAVRLAAAKFARSTASYPVRVEVDNPPPQAGLLVRLGRDSGGVFEADIVERREEARQRFLGFSAQNADGSVRFQATVQDWNLPLDVEGVRGRRELQAELSADGRHLATATLSIVLDDTRPTGVQFVGLPAEVNKNAPLTVRATGADAESGIAKVTFFLGQPVDGKIPPQAASAVAMPAPDGSGDWTAQLPLAALPKGPAAIGVEFVNGAGLKTLATATVNLLDGEPQKGGPGRIHGVVLEGGRPQTGLEVALADAKGKELEKKKTGADGTFLFNNLAPGKYTVSAAKAVTDRRAKAEADVQPSQTAEVTLNLYR